MNSSFVPANAKKAQLIMGMFRFFPDLVIFGSGIIITIVLLVVGQDASSILQLVFCLPMLISALLIMPIPNYHNTLVGLQSIFRFYNQRRNYIWKGWCTLDEYKEDKQ